MNYFLFNKDADYKRGCGYHCKWEDHQLVAESGKRDSLFFSRVLDSQEKETYWHKLQLETGEGQFVLRCYASDSRKINIENTLWEIGDVISTEVFSQTEKENLFLPFFQLETSSQKEVLLHKVQGRYMWFTLAFTTPVVSQIIVYFPKETWIKYLPQVYQSGGEGQDFLEGFLGIFQSEYEELERNIQNSHFDLHPSHSSREMLQFISGILHAEQTHSYPQDKFVNLLAHSHRLYEKRGTAQGLVELLRIYTGEAPYLLEENQESHTVTVLIREKYLAGRERDVITNLIYSFVPVGVYVKIEDLRDYVLLGGHLYLGVNSVLSTFDTLRLDGLSRLDYATLAKETNESEDTR